MGLLAQAGEERGVPHRAARLFRFDKRRYEALRRRGSTSRSEGKETTMSVPSDNLILRTDSYKASHFLQYPPGTTRLLGYFESRGGLYGETVFFGLQYLLEDYLASRVTDADVTRGWRRSSPRTASPSPRKAGGTSRATSTAGCPCGSAPCRKARWSRSGMR